MNRIARRLTLLVAIALPLTALAGEKKQYVVIAPHSAAECLSALDGMVAEKKLDKWDFGCMDGDHTGYLVTRAASKEEALANVPANQRANARVVELNKFTADQVKSFHQGK
jgi:hypothetical protein